MHNLVTSEEFKHIDKLIDEVTLYHQPTLIKGKRNSAILVSQEDWEDIQETLLVASNKKLSDSLIKGKNTPYTECIVDCCHPVDKPRDDTPMHKSENDI
ncbi:MAG TPA: type II toxin-antitoxin system Phd/YefM family antitoxin [Rickettsia endosymbiont of Degeeriella rufa]|nr:type II toxin-antitoxin system Phd/YefM family antitoxin [Rickettsia endosymbiont of Degeeriella rufa]